MHIVLTAQFSPWSAYSGGGQRSTHNLATALSDRGHDVDVVFTKPPWETVPVPDDLVYRVHWAVLPALRSMRSAALRELAVVSVYRTVRGLLRDGTVVHGQGEESALLPRLRREHPFPFPFLVTPRFPDLPESLLREDRSLADWLDLLLRHRKLLLLGLAVRGADLCCPPSAYGARLIREAYGIAEERLRHVHNGVPAEFLAYEHGEPEPDAPLVFFGRFAYDKGADTLIDALGRLGDSGPRALIIGRGDLEEELRRDLQRRGLAGRVELRPWMTHHRLAKTLTQALAAALPSRQENLSLGVLSAMAVGVPLITTRVGGTPEVVEHGRSGLLVDADDAGALADAIAQMQRDPAWARQLGRAGREHVRRHFTWGAAAASFESLYRGLFEAAPANHSARQPYGERR